MWTEIKSFFNTRSTISKVIDLKEVNENLQVIEKSLDLLAEEFTLKNENRKSVIGDSSVSDQIKQGVENKFAEFVKAYSKDLSSQTKERRTLLGRKNQLLSDPQIKSYTDSKNQLKKAFLAGKISEDIFLKIMSNEKTLHEVAPLIIEKSTEAQKKKVDKVMSEFGSGDLKSGSGDKVKTMDQAIAIALSEAGIKKGENTNHIAATTLNAIAEKHKVAPESVREELSQGMKVEMEHTKDKAEARKIALTHLSEIHDYYSRMKEMKEDHHEDMKEKEEGIKKADYYQPDSAATVNSDKEEEDNDFLKEKKKVNNMAKALEFLELAKNDDEIDEFEYAAYIEKAKAGTYADNAANRRLGRAGQKYGKESDEEDDKPTHQKQKEDKEPKKRDEGGDKQPVGREKKDEEEDKKTKKPKKPGVPKVNGVDQKNPRTKKLLDQAKKTSKQNLEAAINQSEDAELRTAAQQELERRKSMENVQAEPKAV